MEKQRQARGEGGRGWEKEAQHGDLVVPLALTQFALRFWQGRLIGELLERAPAVHGRPGECC